MPYQLGWYIEGRVIYRRLWGSLTEDEFRDYFERCVDLLDSGQAPIHLFINDGPLEHLPISPTLGKHNRQIIRHRSLGWTISIGRPHEVIRLITLLPRKIMRLRWRWFDSPEPAKAFLKKLEPTLDWQHANEALLEQE